MPCRSYLNLNYSVQAPEDVHTLVHLGITDDQVLVVLLVLNKPLLPLKGHPGGAREGVSGRGGTGARTRLFDKRFGSLTKTWVFVSLHVISHLQDGTLMLWPFTVYITKNPGTKNKNLYNRLGRLQNQPQT